MRRHLIARSSWISTASSWPKMVGKVGTVYIHHTVMFLKGGARASRKVEAAYWRGVRGVALARGFRDVSYNVGLAPSGRSWMLAGWRVAAHTCNHNHEAFGFVAAGNFQDQKVPRAMVRGFARAINLAIKRGVVQKRPLIKGHRDVGACTGPTACPGNRLYGRLDEIRKLTR
jgi:hypothetical protein